MNICVLVPNKDVYSETFIRAHIDRLPGKVTSLYGWLFPTHKADGTLLLPLPGFFERVRRSLLRELLKRDFDETTLKRQALKEFFKSHAIDVVLAEFGHMGTRVMDVCQEERIPLVVHFHGADAYDYAALKEFGEKYHTMFHTAAVLIAVSRHMEKKLVELGAPKEKIHYSPCGMDPLMFHGSDPAKAPPVFLTVGRFVDKKAQHLVLCAFQKVLEKVPQAKLLMVGEGPLLDMCLSMAKALKIEQAVEFLGVKTHKETAELMRKVRALVLHSIVPASGDSEGTPVVIQEAGGSGLPVISTFHGGIPDVIEDGVTGFLVNEGDVEAMAERMIKIAQDPALAATLGKAAQKRILSNFTLEKNIERLYGAILAAVNGKRDPKAYEHAT